MTMSKSCSSSIDFKVGGLVLGYVTLAFRVITLICLVLALMMVNLFQILEIRTPLSNGDMKSYHNLISIDNYILFLQYNFTMVAIFAFSTISSICFVIGIHKRISKLLIPYLVLDTLITFGVSFLGTFVCIKLRKDDYYFYPIIISILGK